MSEQRVVKYEPLPEEWRGHRVGLLDALLWARTQLRMKRGLWFVTGIETVDSLLPFIRGWTANTRLNGGHEQAWEEFRNWLRDAKGEPLADGWYIRHLQATQGDHDQTALKLLDLVAEYVEQFGSAPRGTAGVRDEEVALMYGPLPREWGGRQVRLLDALLWAHRQMSEGHELLFLTGTNSVHSLFSFTQGWASNSQFNERSDGWGDFGDWLRDVKKEFPPEGWHLKYLRDCQGDDREAALKLLDFVSEYVYQKHPDP